MMRISGKFLLISSAAIFILLLSALIYLLIKSNYFQSIFNYSERDVKIERDILFNDFDFYFDRKPLPGAKRLLLGNLVINKVHVNDSKNTSELELLYKYEGSVHKMVTTLNDSQVGYYLGEREGNGTMDATEVTKYFRAGDYINLSILHFDFDKNDEKVREGIVEYINNISQDNQIRKAVLSDLLENPQKIQLEQELKAKTLKFTEGFFVLSLSKREVDEGN